MHLDLVNKKDNKNNLLWGAVKFIEIFSIRNTKNCVLNWTFECLRIKWETIQCHKFLFSLFCYSKSYKKSEEASKMAVSFRAAKLLRSKGKLRIYRLNVWLRKFISISTCYGLLKNYGRHTFVHWWKFRFWIRLCRTYMWPRLFSPNNKYVFRFCSCDFKYTKLFIYNSRK